MVSAAALLSIEQPPVGTTGRAPAYRFFLYPYLKNSDSFFSDYYLERLFPDDELGAFPADQAKDLLKQIAKEFATKEPTLRTADGEGTLANWLEPVLLEALGAKPTGNVRIVAEEAVFQPTFVLPRAGISTNALRAELRGKEAGKAVSCLIWTLPWRASLDSVATEEPFTALPVTEVVHRALTASDVPWAIITNGRQLRLLSRANSHKPRCFLEADLIALIDRRTDQQAVRAFRFVLGLFSARSFTEVDQATQSLMDRVAEGSDRHGKEIGDELKGNVFSALQELGEGFLAYMRANTKGTDQWRDRKAPGLSRERFLGSDILLEDIYHESLSLMYRLLFLFYAESRELLPLDNELYQSYSLESIRNDVHSIQDDPDPRQFFAKGNTSLWARLTELFGFLDKGWGKVIPPYNGGLFDPEKHEFLDMFAVGDYYLARAIDLLSRTKPRFGQSRGEGRKKVTYRDLDVRHLGSIYEGILEYTAHIADRDYVVIRQGSGETVSEDYLEITELSREQKTQLATWRAAMEEDSNNPTLPRGCKVSGYVEKGEYYLVYGGRESKRKSSGSYYTPDYIVQYIVESTLGPLARGTCRLQPALLSNELGAIGWHVAPHPSGPLSSDEILALKVLDPAMGSGHFLVAATEYLARAYRDARLREGKGPDETQADQEFIRFKRIIAERCIYGVDLNPMAVELAKLSMWLFTMDPGRPLSFLDHHLKPGNAVFGAWAANLSHLPASARALSRSSASQVNIFEERFKAALPLMVRDLFELARRETLSVQDVADKKTLAEVVESTKRPYIRIATLWLEALLDGNVNPFDYASLLTNPSMNYSASTPRASTYRPFHWEIEFPEVWFDDSGNRLSAAGFTAIIGNPPYYLMQGRPEQDLVRRLYPEMYSGSDDILYYFVLLATRILSQGSVAGIILSRYWTESLGSSNIRTELARTCDVQLFVDFRNFQPFGSSVSVLSCIPVFRKVKTNTVARVIRFEDFFRGDESEAAFQLGAPEPFTIDAPQAVSYFDKAQKHFGAAPWFISPDPIDRLLEKIEKNTARLGDITSQTQGIKTGLNSAFIVSYSFAEEAKLEKEILLKLAKGKDLYPFVLADVEQYLIYCHSEMDIDDYPNVKKHLARYRKELEARAECNQDLYPWWRLQRPRDPKIILAQKVLTPLYATYNRFALSAEPPYAVGVTDSIAFIVKKDSAVTELFVAAILNSVVGQFFHKRRAKLKRASYYEYIVDALDRFPVPVVPKTDRVEIEGLVRRILACKRGTEKQRKALDDLNEGVFDLYKFNRKEREVISVLANSMGAEDAAD